MPFLIIQGLFLLSFMLYFLPSALVQHISCTLCVTVAQLCLTLCDPMDCSLLGSTVHGILQARVLEWVVIFFSIIYINTHTHTHTHIYIHIYNFYEKTRCWIFVMYFCYCIVINAYWQLMYNAYF